jgi:hypothetical protein
LELEFLNGKATTTEAVYETASESGMLSLNQRNKGGRPPAPHGQAIATIAFRLAALPPTEQGRCTTDSIIADLKAEYALLGASVNAQSLKKHAEGILRALRERRSAEA